MIEGGFLFLGVSGLVKEIDKYRYYIYLRWCSKGYNRGIF